MSVPEGVVWQHLRQRALDAVPEGVVAAPSAPPGLALWLRQGAYTVASVSNKRVLVEGAAVDIGGGLLAEAALLLDHAQEHSIQIRHQLSTGGWFSPAWMSVSFYYWAYFLVLALTRMTGETPWFLAKEQADLLNGLAPSSTTRVGGGIWIVGCDGYISSTMRSVVIKRSSHTRVHDAVWRLWFSRLRELVRPLTQARSTDPELALYLPQVAVADSLGDSWPADYRNAVNYVPGLAYGAARNHTPTARFKGVPTAAALSVVEAVDRLNVTAGAIKAAQLRSQLPECTKVLVDLTFILDLLAHRLFTEVTERRSIDRRWISGRAQLARRHYLAFGDRDWPTASSAA